MTKKKVFNLASIAIFIIIVSVMIYFGVLKQGFHIDELYTYGLSNSYYNAFPDEFGEWLPHNYYNNYLTTTDATQFEYGSVIHNQINDVHPPIYYILFHTVSSFLPYVFSKWIGISINIVIHLLTCLVLYKLTKYITDNKWVSLITVLFWGASIGAISSVMFIRMYSLITLFQVILVYFAVRFIYSKKYIKYSLLTILTIILGGLTHYYFFLFACFLTIILFVVLLYKKEFFKALVYPISALLSVILSFIIFPAMYNHVLNTNRGTEVLENSANEFNFDNLGTFLNYIYEQLFGNLNFVLIGIIVVLLIASIMKGIMGKKNTIKITKNNAIINFIIVSLPTLIYILVVQQVSHYKVARYIFPVYPFVVLTIVLFMWYCLSFINPKNSKINIGVISFFSVLFLAVGLINNEPSYLSRENREIQEIIENTDNEEAILLTDQSWRISSQVNELRHFEDVYPIRLSDVTDVPNDQMIQNSNEITVFLFDEFNNQENINYLKEFYDFENHSHLYSYNTFNVYQFSN